MKKLDLELSITFNELVEFKNPIENVWTSQLSTNVCIIITCAIALGTSINGLKKEKLIANGMNKMCDTTQASINLYVTRLLLELKPNWIIHGQVVNMLH